jgi:benzil reductase ((S)-benzoin forming)
MRCVVITGVSRGLGRALAERALADPGTWVLGIGRSAFPHERLRLRQCDLSRLEDLPRADELRGLLAGAEEVVLIHNAAVVEPIGPIGELDSVAVAHAVSVNLTAPMVLTSELIEALSRYPEKTLLISSGAANRVIDGWSVYSATKRGCEEFFAHLAQRAVVEIINPGVMDTGMQAAVRAARFAGQERFHDLHKRRELPEPATIAAKII